MKRFIRRFMFAWNYAYETKKWLAFKQTYKIKDPLEER
jgi:hypothetical protein